MQGQLLDIILERESRLFGRRSQPGFLARAIKGLSRRPPVDSMVIVQRAAADPNSLLCDGNALRAWRLDATGLKEISTDQDIAGDGAGRYWRRQLVNFFVSDDGQTIILNEMEGPKDGTLVSATVMQRGHKQTLKVKRARIVLNGYAMG